MHPPFSWTHGPTSVHIGPHWPLDIWPIFAQMKGRTSVFSVYQRRQERSTSEFRQVTDLGYKFKLSLSRPRWPIASGRKFCRPYWYQPALRVLAAANESRAPRQPTPPAATAVFRIAGIPIAPTPSRHTCQLPTTPWPVHSRRPASPARTRTRI